MVKSGNGADCRYQKEIERFREYLIEQEMSENTLNTYLISMGQYFERFEEVSKANAVIWKKELMESGLSPKTVNIRLNSYNKYVTMEGRERDKVKTLRLHKDTAVSNVISVADYKRLCDGLKEDGNLRAYYIVRLMASTGARVSELIRLKKSDFDRGYAQLWTKGKIRRIYIPKSFQKEAKKYYAQLKPDDLLCVNRFGLPISTRGVAQNLQNYAEKYGIDKKVMHPHSFRHMFAVEFLKRNKDLTLLADIMGHSSVATTAIYTRMSKEQQADAVNKAINW